MPSVSQKSVHWAKLEAFLTEHRHLSLLLGLREAASVDVQVLVVKVIGKCMSSHVTSLSLKNPLAIHGQYGVRVVIDNSENAHAGALECTEVGQGVSGGILPLHGACTQGLCHHPQKRQ